MRDFADAYKLKRFTNDLGRALNYEIVEEPIMVCPRLDAAVLPLLKTHIEIGYLTNLLHALNSLFGCKIIKRNRKYC